MSSPIKSQCPHCQTVVSLPRLALNEARSTLHCEQCGNVFLANDHLIVPAKASSNEDDLLIHDDMDIETTEAFQDYHSIDDMEAWLNQHETQSNQNDHSAAPNQEPSLTAPNRQSTNSIKKEAAHFQKANNLASNQRNSAAENAWLEDLLQAQANSDQPQAVHPDDPELTQLLSDMGMKTDDAEHLEKQRQAKIAARLRLDDQPKRQSIATFLWAIGCVVLGLLLAAQYVIFNLDSLIKNPTYAARLQNLCTIAACSLPHADIAKIAISEPQIRASKVKSAKKFSDIQATLINQSDDPQLLPNMKVHLYNDTTLVGEFIARPEDYVLAYESQLGANHQKSIMFTVPLNKTYLNQVIIEPFY